MLPYACPPRHLPAVHSRNSAAAAGLNSLSLHLQRERLCLLKPPVFTPQRRGSDHSCWPGEYLRGSSGLAALAACAAAKLSHFPFACTTMGSFLRPSLLHAQAGAVGSPLGSGPLPSGRSPGSVSSWRPHRWPLCALPVPQSPLSRSFQGRHCCSCRLRSSSGHLL